MDAKILKRYSNAIWKLEKDQRSIGVNINSNKIG